MTKYIYSVKDLEGLTEDITELYFTKDFIKPIDGLIPEWINKIEFDRYSNFNETCEMFPDGLEELIFNYNKCHTIEELRNLPKGLKKLKLGGRLYESLIEYIFPESILDLTFGINFNQEIKENVLPKNLKYLRFDIGYNQEIKENVLPKSVIEIKVSKLNKNRDKILKNYSKFL